MTQNEATLRRLLLGFGFCVTTPVTFSVARSATARQPAILLFPVISILVGVFVTLRTMRLPTVGTVAMSNVFRNRENPQVLGISTRSIATEMVNRQVERYLPNVEFVHRSMSTYHLLLSVYVTCVGLPVTVEF